MLRVELHLKSARGKHDDRLLGVLLIDNVGGTTTSGNYRWRLYGRQGYKMGEGKIEGWPRTRKHGWDLVTKALREAKRG